MTSDVPVVKYFEELKNSDNIFSSHFSALSDEEWLNVLIESINNKPIKGIQFPFFPDAETQMRIHGNNSDTAIRESFAFYQFVRDCAYPAIFPTRDKTFLDFASGWGRIARPFMRDFTLKSMYAFEPNLSFCALARSLNPYICFLTGDFSPNRFLPREHFDLVVGWSVFSHLSEHSAVAWLSEMADILKPNGLCVLTTWGLRFLQRLKTEASLAESGEQIHWYSRVCIEAAGDLDDRILAYNRGEFVWFTSGGSQLYGEAFLGLAALKRLVADNRLPFDIKKYDAHTLSQDAFVLSRNV